MLNVTGPALYIHTAVFGIVIVDVAPTDGTISAEHADCAAIIDTVAGNPGVAADIAAAAFHHHSAGDFSGRGIIIDFYGPAGDDTGTPNHDGAGNSTAGDVTGSPKSYQDGAGDGAAGDIAGATAHIDCTLDIGSIERKDAGFPHPDFNTRCDSSIRIDSDTFIGTS
ncbi:hypothetical protein [Pseudoflavonifractor capillosus]|uniref:hypothetical protein n=1 Tax=Pseudoflavonifractor capillosus TaxID=106588 RepID=UPI00195BC0B2|nr:hypothetical protein [Pseudoflavonifractor capillosus]